MIMRMLKVAFVAFVAVALVACGGGADQSADSGEKMTDVVPFEASFTVELNEDDAKVFVPTEKTVNGNGGTITVRNTLDAPHGFKISKLGLEEVIEANSTRSFKVNNVEPGEYTIDCQLHSAHKESTLVVSAP